MLSLFCTSEVARSRHFHVANHSWLLAMSFEFAQPYKKLYSESLISRLTERHIFYVMQVNDLKTWIGS